MSKTQNTKAKGGSKSAKKATGSKTESAKKATGSKTDKSKAPAKKESKSAEPKKIRKVVSEAAIEKKVASLLKNGREEITTKEELENFQPGSLISYINKNNEFKSGGFLVKINKDHLIFVTPDFQSRIRVKYCNIDKMWVGDVFAVTKDILSIQPCKQRVTDFPVKVGGVVIHYCRNEDDIEVYKDTQKYQKINAWMEYFDIQ